MFLGGVRKKNICTAPSPDAQELHSQMIMLFEIDLLSSFDLISGDFQKYLIFWSCKSNHQKLLTEPDKQFPMDERWIWTPIDYYRLNTKKPANQAI